MPKLASTHSLNDYPRLPISQYKDRLSQSPNTPTALTLEYTYRAKQYRYEVRLSTTPCHYGGIRYWWHCPKCSKRVGVLYCTGAYVCRHCIGANYRIQHLQPIDKHFKRIAELRQRLGWQGGLAHGKGDRPRYMHKQTYDRLMTDYDKASAIICNASMAMIEKNKGVIK